MDVDLIFKIAAIGIIVREDMVGLYETGREIDL